MAGTTYSYKEIWDVIYSKLSEIASWNNARVWAVYNHDIKIQWWISLPAITITPSNWNISVLDSCSYQSTYRYMIRVFDRIQDWIADVEDNMRVLADEVMSKLKEIWTITRNNSNGMTVNIEFEGNWWYTDTQEPLRVYEITANIVAVER